MEKDKRLKGCCIMKIWLLQISEITIIHWVPMAVTDADNSNITDQCVHQKPYIHKISEGFFAHNNDFYPTWSERVIIHDALIYWGKKK